MADKDVTISQLVQQIDLLNRRIGGQKGHPRHERIPFAPDDIGPIIPYELSPQQAKGLIPLDEWFVLQQVDLIAKPYLVTKHRARKYQDPRTGRIVIAPLPVAVKAAGLVGPKLSALAAYQKGDCHMSYSTIQRFRSEVLGIESTNNQTERAIRHLAIDRHITQGTRGQRWCERVRTVIVTCRQQGRRVFAFFCNALNAHFQQEPAPSLLH